MALKQDASTGELVEDGTQVTTSGPATLQVKVYSPFKVYFNQNAQSISGVSGTGPFDILPHHHNFITLLLPSELNIRTESGEQKIKISGGVMHVRGDEVTVFLDV